MNDIKLKLLKVVANVGNPSLCCGATVVQSRPKSHTLTVNLAGLPPSQDGGEKPWEGLFKLVYSTENRSVDET